VDCFEFPRQQADQRTTIRPACDAGRALYEYLLDATATEPGDAEETVCFLGFDDPFPPPEPATATVPSLRLKEWLDRQPGTGIDDLLMCVPLGHRIVTRELVMEWAHHLIQVAGTLDFRRVVSALLRRAAALPGRLVTELKRFRAFLSRGEDPVANFTTWGWRFFSVLMLVLVLAQTAMPTAVYAKGFGSTVSPPGGGIYFGGSAHPPGWSSPFPGSGHPMPRPGMPPVQRRGGYVSGGAGTTTSPYYYSGDAGTTTGLTYYASDAYYNYYYCYDNGRYYYYCTPR
jgi:hypothetical protein